MFTRLSRTSSQMTLQSKPPTQPFVPLSASEHSAHKLLVASSSQSLSLPTAWEWLHDWEHDVNRCCAESCVFVCRIKFAFFAQFLCCLSICCLNFQRVFLLAVSFNLVCHMMMAACHWDAMRIGSRCRTNAVQCYNALQWLCDTSLTEFPRGACHHCNDMWHWRNGSRNRNSWSNKINWTDDSSFFSELTIDDHSTLWPSDCCCDITQ